MKELIMLGDVSYVAKKVETGINTISFKLEGSVPEDIEAAFKDVKSLKVGNTDGEVYGDYPDVEYESLTITATGEIIVTMHILTKDEKQIKDLQISQAEQDEAIAQMLYGGGEE